MSFLFQNSHRLAHGYVQSRCSMKEVRRRTKVLKLAWIIGATKTWSTV